MKNGYHFFVCCFCYSTQWFRKLLLQVIRERFCFKYIEHGPGQQELWNGRVEKQCRMAIFSVTRVEYMNKMQRGKIAYMWLIFHAPPKGKQEVTGPVHEAAGKGMLRQSPKLSCPGRKHFACFLQGWMRSLHDLLRENLSWFQYNQTTSSL